MRAVVQRVKESSVIIEGQSVATIGQGLMVLLGVARNDSEKEADFLAEKISNLRIFEDKNEKMNHSLLDKGGQMLVVSQFTLLGNCRKGRRPSYVDAAEPDMANALYEYFIEKVRAQGIDVQSGRFRAKMDVHLINDGPVTLVVES
ncbi:MAG: D-aminoacyl-tRNA deacylase [Desulfobacterales bacterium]|jgi:D-tyrosyl-tRNA(Tyr) deacylase|nr:D-aminoacyl-tRNA deacylase [Desulfobacterales bacterium]